MLRIALFSGLLIVFFLQVVAIGFTLRKEAPPVIPVAYKDHPVELPETPVTIFYPPVPAELPDLNSGYIFNEARLLAVEPKEEIKDAGLMIAMADVFYIGSVISNDKRVGVIGYQEPASDLQQDSGRPKPGRQAALVDKHAQLAPGEIFSGYLVVDILPEKIIFEKDGIQVEKSIMKANKVRRSPPLTQQVERRHQGRPPATSMRQGLDGSMIRMMDPERAASGVPSGVDGINAGGSERVPTRIL
jgi:hypothetical protein